MAGVKDSNWLIKQLVEILEQSDEDKEVARQLELIATKKTGAETLQIKQIMVKSLGARRRSVQGSGARRGIGRPTSGGLTRRGAGRRRRGQGRPDADGATVTEADASGGQVQEAAQKEVPKNKQGGKVDGKVAPATKKARKEGAEAEGDMQMEQADEDGEL